MLTFREPDGSSVAAPDLEYVRAKVMDADQAYWDGPNGGQAMLEYRDSALSLTVQPEGVLVQHQDSVGRLQWLRDEEVATDGWVLHYDGQEFWHVRARFFVSRDLALRAVTAFYEGGDAGAGLPWTPTLDMSHEPVDPSSPLPE